MKRQDVARALEALDKVGLGGFEQRRISEALRLTPSSFNIGAPTPAISVVPSKRRGVTPPVTAALHQQAIPWVAALLDTSNPHPHALFCTLRPCDLNAWLRARLRGTRDADATWHGFRRGCATLLWLIWALLRQQLTRIH